MNDFNSQNNSALSQYQQSTGFWGGQNTQHYCMGLGCHFCYPHQYQPAVVYQPIYIQHTDSSHPRCECHECVQARERQRVANEEKK